MNIKILLLPIIISFSLTHAQTSNSKFIADIKTADSLFASRDFAMAKQVYDAVLKDTTNNALAWNKLGFSEYNLKLYDMALKHFRKSLSQNPAMPLKAIVYSRIARIFSLQRKNQPALTALDSAVNLGYTNMAEFDTLADFNPIRNGTRFKDLRNIAYLNANPCLKDPHAREFDFWVGEWDVYATGTKFLVGHSVVQMISGGCALLENWESPNSNGKSINFIDPVTKKWKQSWAGNYANGIQEFTNGEYKDGAMHFTFEFKNPQGATVLGRFIFYNQGPNRVRQFNETSADGGKTWTTSYDFTYARKGKG